jgi:hypothetical protein
LNDFYPNDTKPLVVHYWFKQEFMFIEIGAFLVLQVFRHPLHPLIDVVGEFTRNGRGDNNVGGDAKT